MKSFFNEKDIAVFSELQSLIENLLIQYDQQVSLEFRILDITAEIGELAIEFNLKLIKNSNSSEEIIKNIEEEVGDIGFAVFSLISQLNLNIKSFDFSKVKRNNFTDNHDLLIVFSFLSLCNQIGKVAKALLKMTDYGKRKYEKVTPQILLEVENLLLYLLSLTISLDIDLNVSIHNVLKKYEKRAAKGGSFSSENEIDKIY